MMKRVRPRLVRQLKLRLQVHSNPTSNFEFLRVLKPKKSWSGEVGRNTKQPKDASNLLVLP